MAKLSGVVVEFRNLVDLANGIKSVDTSGMSTFAQNLTNLGNAGIDGFINAFTNANSRVSTAANTMITTFINAAKAQQGNLTSTFTTMINGIVATFYKQVQSVHNHGTDDDDQLYLRYSYRRRIGSICVCHNRVRLSDSNPK